MAKKQKKTYQQQHHITKKEQQAHRQGEQGTFGAKLSAALKAQEKEHKQTKKAEMAPVPDCESFALTASEKELIAEFDKLAAQVEELMRSEEVQLPRANAKIDKKIVKPGKPIRQVIFVPTTTKVVEDARQVETKVIVEDWERSIQTQHRCIRALTKVEESPFTLEITKQELQKSQKQNITASARTFNGCSTQVSGQSPKDERDIIIGIDFGTSSTKIVVRDMSLNQAYAVPFTSFAPKDNCYLLPTSIFVNYDGTLRLDFGDLHESSLKLKFIDNPDRAIIQGVGANASTSLNAEDLFVGYLALALRELRQWFFTQKYKQYARSHLHWNINIGIPSEDYGSKELRSRFEVAAQAAWFASVQKQEVDIDLIKRSRDEIEETNARLSQGDKSFLDEAHLHPGYFSTHPEVIMEVVGYVKSPLGQQGTHLLIDIGATTLDVASFLVGKRQGEDIYPMLSCQVARLGTMMLHNKRIATVKSQIEAALSEISAFDPIKPLPQWKRYQIGFHDKDIDKVDSDFSSSCYAVIGKIVRHTRENRDPYSHVWQSKLPVFICGGGSKEKLYIEVVQQMGIKLSNTIKGFKGFNVLRIPKPETLQAPEIAPEEYRRLAVAYGLSFSTDEIGEIIPESAIENQPRMRVVNDFRDRYIGAEQM